MENKFHMIFITKSLDKKFVVWVSIKRPNLAWICWKMYLSSSPSAQNLGNNF
jgi:hypothetical protein